MSGSRRRRGLIETTVYMAFQTYHRHQVIPNYGWDHSRRRAAVIPAAAERHRLAFCLPGAGGALHPKWPVSGKVIVVGVPHGRGRYRGQAAWYDDLVHGSADADDQGPALDVDHAMHLRQRWRRDPRLVRTTRIVNYGGFLDGAGGPRRLGRAGRGPEASTVYQVDIEGQGSCP